MIEHKPDLISPWVPMSKPIDVKHVGKLLEELGELQAALSRCLVQGLDEREPITNKLNREWLQEEVADVQAGIELLIEHFDLDSNFIIDRRYRKKAGLRRWHRMLA